ncbi:large conductance mechanosensitive channel protein MscL [Catelliglobosispora koreensis]|uniref:large conductance mechanosensitive channel protein MscL n=1 Tax=Catelliglobosispora koreensis TaxID=129052 RepID=UPI0003717836|nr:large conductance mechanosensitive channel protein MscL [Catelliglobosispora koreensis]
MLKGFKDFITRGNVVDLAVGVVIGAAFTTVVTGFTDSFLTPLINIVGVGSDGIGGVIPLPGKDNYITYGAFLSKIVGFLITAAVVYFLVVLPLNKFFRKEEKSEAPAEELLLLREIRDALVAQNGGVPAPRQESNHATDVVKKVQ